MASLSWYKRYPRDALEGMQFLTLEERGAYNTVLDLIYLRGGDLPDDDRFIAGNMRCDVRVWRRIKKRLIALGKLQCTDGAIRNRRADVEVDSALAITVRIADVRRSSGRKSGEVRRENKRLDEQTNEQKTNRIQTPESDKEERKSSVPNGTDAPAGALMDDKKLVFDYAMTFLPDRHRSIVGKLLKATRDKDTGVDLPSEAMRVLMRARTQVDPVSFLMKFIGWKEGKVLSMPKADPPKPKPPSREDMLAGKMPPDRNLQHEWSCNLSGPVTCPGERKWREVSGYELEAKPWWRPKAAGASDG